MGLHTGEASVGTDGYVGFAVHQAARIGDAGHGGQVLLSSTTANLVRHDLPGELGLLDLGPTVLPDFDRPERLFQLEIPGLALEVSAALDPRAREGPAADPEAPHGRPGLEQAAARARRRSGRAAGRRGGGGLGRRAPRRDRGPRRDGQDAARRGGAQPRGGRRLRGAARAQRRPRAGVRLRRRAPAVRAAAGIAAAPGARRGAGRHGRPLGAALRRRGADRRDRRRRLVRGHARALLARGQPRRPAPDGARDRRPALGGRVEPALAVLPRPPARRAAAARRAGPAPARAVRRDRAPDRAGLRPDRARDPADRAQRGRP